MRALGGERDREAYQLVFQMISMGDVCFQVALRCGYSDESRSSVRFFMCGLLPIKGFSYDELSCV